MLVSARKLLILRWVIFFSDRLLDRIGSIRYGVVPLGYKQIYPENGKELPSLLSGTNYDYWFQIVNAPHIRGKFEIKDGKIIDESDSKNQ